MNGRFSFPLSVLLCGALPAYADEIADKVCPLLEEIAADSDEKAEFAVQAQVLFGIVGLYEENYEVLRDVVPRLDESTIAGCPEAREKILAKLGMSSLEQAMR